MLNVSGKRPAIGMENHNKLHSRKTNKKLKVVKFKWKKEILPIELVALIFSYLPQTSLFNVRKVNNLFEKAVNLRWQQIKRQDHLDFEWAARKNKRMPDMVDWCISRAVLICMLQPEPTQVKPALLQLFPCLETWPNPNSLEIKEEVLNTYGGEALLAGLIKAKSEPDSAKLLFDKALALNATCISLVAYRVLRDQLKDSFLEELALQAARLGDYSSLEMLLLEYSPESIKEFYKTYRYPPILARLADIEASSKEFEQADLLLTEALASYGRHPPIATLYSAASVKFNLKQFAEAVLFFTRILDSFEDDCFLCKIALHQCHLNNCGQITPANVLANLGNVKFELQEWKVADLFFTKAIDTYDDKAPADVLCYAAFIKFQLDDWEAADQLYTKALEAYGDRAPADIIAGAALVKYALNALTEADQLYTKALEAYDDRAPADIIANAALVKLELNALVEADQLYTKALEAYGDRAPAEVVANAAYIKSLLS